MTGLKCKCNGHRSNYIYRCVCVCVLRCVASPSTPGTHGMALRQLGADYQHTGGRRQHRLAPPTCQAGCVRTWSRPCRGRVAEGGTDGRDDRPTRHSPGPQRLRKSHRRKPKALRPTNEHRGTLRPSRHNHAQTRRHPLPPEPRRGNACQDSQSNQGDPTQMQGDSLRTTDTPHSSHRGRVKRESRQERKVSRLPQPM